MALKYKDLLPIGSALIIAGTFFFLGLLAGNLPYDFKTLYTQASDADFDNSLKHYQTWAQIPTVALHLLHSFIGLGFIGILIKLYKPSEDAKYFEYGSLLFYVIAFCIYLTNLRTGAESAVIGEWGEVDYKTGINVIAASEAMIAFLLLGVLLLQGGLYYGEWEFQQRLEAFNKEIAEEEATKSATESVSITSDESDEATETSEKQTKKTRQPKSEAPQRTPRKTRSSANKKK
ncbi:hypothetical protein WICMUC_002252 [Wickerhamomyces mucosus]|uniref:Shr3 amino acid permease chaperone n=1 Tax=Wickerhamomyces mucosus TaxID=1378264 RepID=A0A9P8PPR0_9ASCO|nr:hypothetical protein WICMUC_002252 [Wickerhamomyces mucosus]